MLKAGYSRTFRPGQSPHYTLKQVTYWDASLPGPETLENNNLMNKTIQRGDYRWYAGFQFAFSSVSAWSSQLFHTSDQLKQVKAYKMSQLVK